MAVRRDWFESSGGFDERFFMYFEDVDLCLRALLEGHRIRFVPTSVAYHRFGASAGALLSPLRSYYSSRNRLLVIARNFDGRSALIAAALSMAQDAGVIGLLLLRRRYRVAGRSARNAGRGTLAGLALAAGPYRARRRELAARRVRTVADLRRAGLMETVPSAVREHARVARAIKL